MIGNKYKYCWVDTSYILTRNLYSVTRGLEPEEYNPGDVVRMTIQTLNKCARDFNITCDKMIFIKDTWSKEHKGYFRTLILKGLYKDSRKYMTEDVYEDIKSDPNSSEEDIKHAWAELCLNKCKQKAKNMLIYEMGKFGVPSISVEGWEFDDICYMAACMSYGEDKKSVILTKDSDMKWCINPNVDWFRIPTGGSAPEVITYDQVYNEMPEILRNHQIPIYEYNAVMNSLGVSHNDMRKTIKPGVDTETAAVKILLNNDYSDIDPNMMETFENQRRSYNIGEFPRFNEAMDKIKNVMPVTGRLGSLDEFHKFCEKNKITGISDKYFTDFISRFDQKLYTGNDY